MFNDQDLEIEMCSPNNMTAEEWRKKHELDVGIRYDVMLQSLHKRW